MSVACSILHVDDDDDIRLIVEMSLQLDPALDVRGVPGADEALRAIGQGEGWAPDALILDYRLPGTTGVDLVHRIKSIPKLRQIPFIFLTGRVHEPDRVRMREAGAAGVLTKPFDPITLARDVRGLLDGC